MPTVSRFAVAVVFLAGCGDERGSRDFPLAIGRGPALVAIDSLAIQEPDSVEIGNHTFLLRGRDGSVYVTDVDRRRVLAFTPAGSLRTVFGRHGSGPGEFQLPAVAGLIAGDSLLAVADISLRRISVFEARTGAFLRGASLPAQDVGQAWTGVGDTLVMAAHLGRALILKWPWRSDTVLAVGATPDRLLSSIAVAVRHGRSDLVPTPTGFLALLPTEPGLHVFDREGRAVGFVEVPRSRRRRGAPADLVERQAAREAAGGPDRFQPVGSASMAMQRLSDGTIALLYVDLDVAPATLSVEFTGQRYFLTLLSSDLSRACLDTPVPVGSDAVSIPSFRGDSLFVFSRVVTDSGSVRSVVYGFRVSADGCDWVPTGGIGSPRP